MSTPETGTGQTGQTGQTGPRTPEGEAIAARNAIAHGLTSNLPVIPGVERQGDWHVHPQGIFDEIALPSSPVPPYRPTRALVYTLTGGTPPKLQNKRVRPKSVGTT
ncbi:MAG: hypothetical protein HY332_10295 [Chloroflexi bacterium]|nr:hypothetical protein [Chloroflexota bacterium]